jgi:hypothetical protein
VHRRERGQAESSADLFQARRIAVLLDEIVQEIQDFLLALGQWQHARTISNKKRKSTKELDVFTFPGLAGLNSEWQSIE